MLIKKLLLLLLITIGFTSCAATNKNQAPVKPSNSSKITNYKEQEANRLLFRKAIREQLNNSISPSFNNYNREPEDELFIYKQLMKINL